MESLWEHREARNGKSKIPPASPLKLPMTLEVFLQPVDGTVGHRVMEGNCLCDLLCLRTLIHVRSNNY